MALTRSFKDLVQTRAAHDPASGDALLREAINIMLTGDVDTGNLATKVVGCRRASPDARLLSLDQRRLPAPLWAGR
jgi:hypothetical protein